jgi:tetratricopeptide (TPR) repeat protein
VVALDSFVHHFGSRSFVDGQVDYRRQIDEKFQVFKRKWNLASDARDSAELNLEKLLKLGYLPPLHFHPLPEAPGVRRLPVPEWELDHWIDLGEAFFTSNQAGEAERIFRSVLAEDPGHGRAANNLACALWQSDGSENKKQALQVLEGLLQRDPDNEDARWNLQEMSAAADTSCQV